MPPPPTRVSILIATVCLVALTYLICKHTVPKRSHEGFDRDSTPNAKIGDPNFDAENDGEFNAVDTVEALPEISAFENKIDHNGTNSHVSVLCGDGPDHGRSYWVVDVYVIDSKGRGIIDRSFHYDIHTGKLSNATTEPTP
jgi:hypothetical protein